MSTWNTTSSEERLRIWKRFRQQIKDDVTDDMLNKTAKFFADVPIGSRCVDFYNPDTWPTPWEILYHNLFCINSVSLLIYHTLILTLEDQDRIRVVLIEDDRDRFIVPLLDEKYMFNYLLGEISNVEDFPEVEVLKTFSNKEARPFA